MIIVILRKSNQDSNQKLGNHHLMYLNIMVLKRYLIRIYSTRKPNYCIILMIIGRNLVNG
jgi:hypothetical protein